MRVSMRRRYRAGSGARAYKLFEGDRNRNRTPEPVDFSGQARGNSTNVRTERVRRTAHGCQRTTDQVHAGAAPADQEPGRARLEPRADRRDDRRDARLATGYLLAARD